MIQRWIIRLMVVLVLILAACGGEDSKEDDRGDNPAQTPSATRRPLPTPAGPTATPRDPAPRSESLPQVEPFDFEAPFSVGNFVRQSMRGNVTSERTGGLQASYLFDQNLVSLTVYYFEQADRAVETVRFVLEGSSVTGAVEPAYYGPTVAYGVVTLRSGGNLAAWSHYEWAFIAQTAGSADVLDEFLQSFPY